MRFIYEGVEWIAKGVGRGASGTARDRTVPLVLVIFARADDPERPLREGWFVGRHLDRASEDELGELLVSARPARSPDEPREIFSDTRLRKKDG